MARCKGSTSSAGDTKNVGSIPGLGRSLGEGNDNPLQYSCLGNLMDRRAWRVIESVGLQTVEHNLDTRQQHSSEQIFWGTFGCLSAWSVWSVRGYEKLAGSSCLCQCYHFSGAKCAFLQLWKRARMGGLSRLAVWREVRGFHGQRLEGAAPREDATAGKGNVAPVGKARWLQLPPILVSPMGWGPHGWWKYSAQQQRAQGVDMASRELTSLRWSREPEPGAVAMMWRPGLPHFHRLSYPQGSLKLGERREEGSPQNSWILDFLPRLLSGSSSWI